MPNVETLLRDHVTLQVDCIDRLYLNGYVPTLPATAELVVVPREAQGLPGAVAGAAQEVGRRLRRGYPRIRSAGTGSRSSSSSDTSARRDVARRRLARFRHREGVVSRGRGNRRRSTGSAPTRRTGATPSSQRRDGKPPIFSFLTRRLARRQPCTTSTSSIATSACASSSSTSYPPFNVRVWLNGHEWAKRQLDHRGAAIRGARQRLLVVC